MPKISDNEVSVQLSYRPPPVLPDIVKELEEYLLCPERLPIHNYEQAQQFWPRVPNPDSLFHCEQSPLGTTLKVDRDPTTGKILQFREVPVDDIGYTAKNSVSLRRAPQPFNESVRGNVANFPFWPGGFPDLTVQNISDDQDTDIDFENDLLYIAPGFTRGVEFKADGYTPITEEDKAEPQTPIDDVEQDNEEEISSTFNLMDVMKQEEDLLGLWKESDVQTQKDDKKDAEKMIIGSMIDKEEDEDENLSAIPKKDNIPVLMISKAPPPARKRVAEWAEKIDETKPVLDFRQRIPNPAHTFKFDLDPFQQQAILKVEEHSHVFVAAHTSAGKTVVAEYAIALSQKHMTKTVYTSPIKALSNQKFRDFKATFEDVGLITGDIQINPEANCLIMTTEILRSMLYQGSEIMRDLEFVIFDEVHYINNTERGHVWEETLILLPPDCTIIMLSATVNNTLEFADWVGRTKKKKMYVISTLKRPVPLEHFLYCGTGGKQKNDRFMVVNAEGKFINEGYRQAIEAKMPKKSGPITKGSRPVFGKKQENTMWSALIDHLKQEKGLPVIAFTLSRKRCDENARDLKVDLTTAREKSYIRVFFRKCLDKLKDCDKKLPQVKQMQNMLEKGIGVHHSGILPILKEIVEMLFQEEKVKLLFATETFAMGVNMPARTVIFDSVLKFTGLEVRPLLPAEYIQMAGRAGRRGLDKRGIVMVLCKTDVPEGEVLKEMMLGTPAKLTSQFRLTYSVILRLLRVGQITVEDMMRNSFMEFRQQTLQSNYIEQLKLVEEDIAKLNVACIKSGNESILTDLYHNASDYLELFMDSRDQLLSQNRVAKDLQPGRVILITYQEHVNKLALLLKVDPSRNSPNAFKYHVLVLCNNEHDYGASGEGEIRLSIKTETKKEEKKQKSEKWYKMLGLVNYGTVFIPNGISEHKVLVISNKDILEIYTTKIKIDTDLILNNWTQRQQPRFRDSEPGPSCIQAVQQLTQLSLNSSEMLPIKYVEDPDKMKKLLRQIRSVHVEEYPNFEEQFETIFFKKELEEKQYFLKFQQSHESMELYPDYMCRVKVLRNLGYIKEDNQVDLKGMVAIKMRNNELLITEIVLANMLTDLPPAEIAALLSCLVCPKRSNSKNEEDYMEGLGQSLKKGIKQIVEIEKKIRDEEKANCVIDAVNESLNFAFVHVVHEWAKGQPFSTIMEWVGDAQEGIIVRCIQQLSETLNDVKDAASIIGNQSLKTKMEDAQKAIKRDIVFTASLYTSGTTYPKAEELDYENKDE